MNSHGPRTARVCSAWSSSGDSAVRLATTKTFALSAMVGAYPEPDFLIRREVCVPLAQRAEGAPELALGDLVVERGVDVGHVQRLARRRQPLQLAGKNRQLAPERQRQP